MAAAVVFSKSPEAFAEEAPELGVTFEAGEAGKEEFNALIDNDLETAMEFPAGTFLKLTTTDEIRGIYVMWDAEGIPGEWTLSYGDESKECGREGFLHEFVEIPKGYTECILTFSKNAGICELILYGEGEIPSTVQKWERLQRDADILVFVPHSGDEIIDYGAIAAIYGGEKDLYLQFVYMCEYVTSEEKIKEHEILDSLWRLGVKYYSVGGSFRNKRLTSLSLAEKFYGKDNVLRFVTENIRKYRPLVVVSPDYDGEYGNGTHILLANAITDAVNHTGDPEYYAEMAKKYGTWDVPKTYVHKYRYKTEGTITFDLEKGIKELLEKTIAEKLTDTWCGTHFSNAKYTLDDAAYFGLYRSTVGADTDNDLTENVVTYEEQARIAAEEARQREEYERLKAYYEEQLKIAARCGQYIFGRHTFSKLGELSKEKNAMSGTTFNNED